MHNVYRFLAGIFLVGGLIFGETADAQTRGKGDIHQPWDRLVQKYTDRGLFRYKDLHPNSGDLQSYLKTLSSVSEKDFSSWSKFDQIAFLINAYNAFTVDLILRHYPVGSIGDIGGPIRAVNLARGAPWKKFEFTLLGDNRTLDWIEHSKLRVDYNEPRIHFAINCASIGCPALRNEAYVGSRLEAQLESATRSFFADRTKNRWDRSKNTLYLSKILDWFRGDFEAKSGSLVNFIRPYFSENIPDNAKIEFTGYDWSLNEVR